MLATIYKSDTGYTAEYERQYNVAKEIVWSSLISNNNFKFWMEHLEITNLSKGGNINFHHNDGSGNLEKMAITDYKSGEVLEFNWGVDTVRFEVHPHEEGSTLILKEFINEITDHTPKDLAGWHVCLLRFGDLLNGESTPFSKAEWEKWYSEYQLVIKHLEK